LSRRLPAGCSDGAAAVLSAPRALLLAAVAADVYTGYALRAATPRWWRTANAADRLEREHRRGAAAC
jgi:hypothetical protein